MTGEYTKGCLTATPQDEGANVQYDYDAATRIATISIPESGKDICYYVKFAEEVNAYSSNWYRYGWRILECTGSGSGHHR